jgi:hypothetical protein
MLRRFMLFLRVMQIGGHCELLTTPACARVTFVQTLAVGVATIRLPCQPCASNAVLAWQPGALRTLSHISQLGSLVLCQVEHAIK